jgi:hypothetical protein
MFNQIVGMLTINVWIVSQKLLFKNFGFHLEVFLVGCLEDGHDISSEDEVAEVGYDIDAE